MNRTLATPAALLALAACAALGQAPAAAPSFEVASVKAAPPLDVNAIMSGKMHIGMKTDAARVDIGFSSLTDLVCLAYRVKPFQVSGPEWMGSQRFDIQAKIPDGASVDQVPEMLQALLADRFKLVLHRDNADHAVYALIVGKGGSKLKESPPDPAVPATPPEPPKGAITIADGNDSMQISGSPQGRGMTITGGKTGTMHLAVSSEGTIRLEMEKVSMAALADSLTRFLDRPVIDMTGIQGNYQVALELSQADLIAVARTAGMGMPGMPPMAMAGRPADAASDPSGSSVFVAVQQLGLKLDPQKQPMDRLVIDHLERTPTEN
jgi:uncharacterized protein (TIGR03435 family)